MNNSRFKFFLIENAGLAAEAREMRPALENIFAAFDDGRLSIPETLFLTIATVCERRKPGQWWMKGASEYAFPEIPRASFQDHARSLNLPVELSSLALFFKNYRLKNLPQAVPRILFLWSAERANLELSETFVQPERMLELQAEGRRIVTLSRASFLNGTSVDGKRDALEFLLHDMAHANLFFSETHEEQKTFFGGLLAETRKKNRVEGSDSLFKVALEYIMSDMNSSRAHLEQSLKAAVIDRARREKSLSAGEQLSAETEDGLRADWGGLWR